jgi:transposase
MKRFVEGLDRGQITLFPETLEDFVAEDNAVRVIEAFVEGLDLGGLGFGGVDPKATGRPAYHPSVLLKLYIYGYLNRVQSSRRLEREAGRNLEVMWLCGRLVPDHKTIADFRKGLKDQELIRGINSPENGGSHSQGLRSVRGALPSARSVGGGQRCDRRQQIQGGEQPGPQLHGGQDEAAHGADRKERRALSRSTG